VDAGPHAGEHRKHHLSPDGELLLTGGGDATARVHRTHDGVETSVLRGHTDTVAEARYGGART
jgi:WD40 repeat protein